MNYEARQTEIRKIAEARERQTIEIRRIADRLCEHKSAGPFGKDADPWHRAEEVMVV